MSWSKEDTYVPTYPSIHPSIHPSPTLGESGPLEYTNFFIFSFFWYFMVSPTRKKIKNLPTSMMTSGYHSHLDVTSGSRVAFFGGLFFISSQWQAKVHMTILYYIIRGFPSHKGLPGFFLCIFSSITCLKKPEYRPFRDFRPVPRPTSLGHRSQITEGPVLRPFSYG